MRNCVICKKAFDEQKADHVLGRDPKELWTCSKVCQAVLDKRAGAAEELRATAREEEPEVEEDGPSEADKGRAALAGLVAPEPPATGGGSLEYARAARHMISAGEELSSPEDRAVVFTLAHGFLGRAIGDVPDLAEEEAEGSEEAAPEAGTSRPVGRARGSGGTEHVVSRDGAGALSCTCPGFKFRKTCRHVDEARRFPGRFS